MTSDRKTKTMQTEYTGKAFLAAKYHIAILLSEDKRSFATNADFFSYTPAGGSCTLRDQNQIEKCRHTHAPYRFPGSHPARRSVPGFE